jgi:hypothetical protein
LCNRSQIQYNRTALRVLDVLDINFGAEYIRFTRNSPERRPAVGHRLTAASFNRQSHRKKFATQQGMRRSIVDAQQS